MHTTSKMMVLGCIDCFILTWIVYTFISQSQKWKLPRSKYRHFYKNHDARHGHVVRRIQPDDICINLNMRSHFPQAHHNILLYLTKNLLYLLIIHNTMKRIRRTPLC